MGVDLSFERCEEWAMFSKTAKPIMRSAAWRISLWATLAFACGTMVVFIFLHQFVAGDIQRRTDAWLAGEAGVLSDVAGRTPKGWLYGRVVGEVAELASREVPHKRGANAGLNDSVFFLQTATDGSVALWVGAGDVNAHLAAVRNSKIVPDTPTSLHITGFDTPFRVVCVRMDNGSRIYLGLSERDQLRVLAKLRLRFVLLWLLIVLIGSAIVFYSTRRVLRHIQEITEAASRIGEADLSSRVPAMRKNDEVSQLAITLNRMLDRIERSVHQLHTITGSLAHDLRSPLTAVRAKLEMSLTAGARDEESESIVSAIEDMDRLTEFLDKSLDVAEAKANALRLNRVAIDLDDLLRVMIDLYEPSMSEKGLRVKLLSAGWLEVSADAALLHRMIANLFDNELKHLPASCAVTISLRAREDAAVLVVEDNGPGFEPEVRSQIFERRVKGRNSTGHGLGLAFVEAVVRVHGGAIEASNRPEGGARLTITLPLAVNSTSARLPSLAHVSG
jgi:signal transduction histidine kinase